MPQRTQDSRCVAATMPKSRTNACMALSRRSLSLNSRWASKAAPLAATPRGHSSAPLCLKRMPVAAREKMNRNACISLPNGNQMKNTQTLRMWTASSVS